MNLALHLLLAGSLALLQQEPGSSRPWEYEHSDLPVDARITFGHLENGLRYAWMKNGEPKERCYVRLHVDVGALAETDAQDGMAHFLEHMAFNGSKHFKAGTLVEWFQEHGMAFGADLNAHTTFSQTVYKLDLAHSDEETLREGLTVLRDFADGLLLEPEEVQKEKGVIDAEQASGDTAGRRVFEKILDEQYAGTRYVLRDIIGEKDVRDAFTAEAVRKFYEHWYRPELMTILIVGDLGDLDPAPLVVEAFADMAVPDSPVPEEPPIGKPELEERFFAIYEPEIPSVAMRLERLIAFEDEPDDKETRTDDVDLAAARRMLNQRYSELVKKEGTPFLNAQITGAGGLEVYEGETLVVSAEPELWQDAFVAADYELRRALSFGFRQAELDEVRANWLRSLDEGVERERTRHSGGFVNELETAAEERYVPTDAKFDRSLLRPVIEALTIDQCHDALVEAWGKGVVNLFTTGSFDLGDGAGGVLQKLYERAREREVEEGEEIEESAFAYASSADLTGKIKSEEHIEDLDAWLFEFENGVRLNVKATDFKEREIQVQARVAEGLLTIAPENYAVAWAGSQAFNLAGLGKHTVDDLRRLTAGKRVGVRFGLSNDAFHLSGATTADDLLFELELLCATLTDPGWRDDGLRLLQKQVPLLFDRLKHDPSGPLYLEFMPALFHGDLRFAELPPRAAIEAVEMQDVRAWLAPQLANGPVEVTIVGDLDVEAVKAAAARTLGVLPERRAYDPHEDRLVVAPPATDIHMERAIETKDEKTLVLLALPTEDGRVAERRRSLKFLGQVVQDRLRVRVREELGAAYSPGAAASPNETFPGIGLLTISTSLPPEQSGVFTEAALAIVREIAEKGVTAEETKRLAEPVLAQIRDAKRTNGYWAQTLGEAQRRPETLDDERSLEPFYRALDPEKLSELAAENFDAKEASVLVVHPLPKEEKEKGEASEAGAGRDG